MLTRQLRRMVKPVAAAFDRLRPPTPGVVVLAYHRVGAGTESQVDLPTAMFDDQMAYLAEHHTVVTLDQAVATLSAAQPDPAADTVVAVTFDDGTPDVVDNALPILTKHKIPMTLYLASGFVEDQRGFWDPQDQPLSWAGVNELTSSGLVDIGSHTHTHKLLDRESPQVVAEELDTSIASIEANVGTTPAHFAYPKALRPSAEADTAVRQRFVSAAIAGTKANPWAGTDPHLLTRSPIQRSDGMRWFEAKAVGGLGLEDAIRDRIKQRAYRNAAR